MKILRLVLKERLVLICSKCGCNCEQKNNFCPNCGAQLKNTNNQCVKSGDQSMAFIGNNNEILIDKIENKIVKNEIQSLKYNIKIGRKIGKTKSFIHIGLITSIVGFIGSAVSIYSFFADNNIYGNLNKISKFAIAFSVFFLIGMAILAACGEIKRKKFIRIFPKSIFAFNLILFDDGSINIVKIQGKCPKCGGKIELWYFEKEHKSIGVCTRNKDHKYEFDYTDFDKDLNKI